MEINSADTNQPSNGEICIDKSYSLPNNPVRQKYRYTFVPIEAAKAGLRIRIDLMRIRIQHFFL